MQWHCKEGMHARDARAYAFSPCSRTGLRLAAFRVTSHGPASAVALGVPALWRACSPQSTWMLRKKNPDRPQAHPRVSKPRKVFVAEEGSLSATGHDREYE